MKLLLGIDLTEVDRVAEVLERWGDRFTSRVFRPGELSARRRHPRARAEHVAGRFAAKEAAMKALGLGWRGLAFREIEVTRDIRGKPLLALHGRALARAQHLRVESMEVSISHSRDAAVAVVALLTPDP
ncbi:MAG TPA: holo-ACP synthase [Thermoanaerobaculia bacterium]